MCTISSFQGNPRNLFAAIFDGHSGPAVAQVNRVLILHRITWQSTQRTV